MPEPPELPVKRGERVRARNEPPQHGASGPSAPTPRVHSPLYRLDFPETTGMGLRSCGPHMPREAHTFGQPASPTRDEDIYPWVGAGRTVFSTLRAQKRRSAASPTAPTPGAERHGIYTLAPLTPELR
jgi:hypothetical protein